MTIGLCKEGALVMEGCKHQRHYCPRLGDEWSPSCLGQLPCLSSVLCPIILVSHSLSFGNSQTPAWCQCEWRVRSLLNNTSRFFVLLLKEKQLISGIFFKQVRFTFFFLWGCEFCFIKKKKVTQTARPPTPTLFLNHLHIISICSVRPCWEFTPH